MSYLATGITKRYGGVRALDGVSIEFAPGSVHALLGENGAGKSTLVGILGGVVAPDDGELSLGDQSASFSDAREAARAGVATVSQELRLYPELTVLENLFTNNERVRAGFLDRAAMRADAARVIDELGLEFSLDAPLERLTLAERQLVEIGRALLLDPRVLILDEPTSALGPDDIERLLAVVQRLAARGVAICYVSHMLDEVMRVCDTVTVLRNGQNVWRNEPLEGKTPRDLVRAMIGSDIEHVAVAAASHPQLHEATAPPDAGSLVLEGIVVDGELDGVSLRVGPGEIVGLAGRPGAGHQSVLEIAFGMSQAKSGRLALPDGSRPRSIRDATRHGAALVPGDRRRLGLMLEKSIAVNVSSVRRDGLGRGGFFIDAGEQRERAVRASERLRVASAGPDTPTGALSGGNQQKIVFAKWLEVDPELLLLDDPTRGVDIGARAEMHGVIREIAAAGTPVAMTSTDVPELIEVCTRIVVFHQGRIRANLAGEEMTVENVLYAMSTATEDAAEEESA